MPSEEVYQRGHPVAEDTPDAAAANGQLAAAAAETWTLQEVADVQTAVYKLERWHATDPAGVWAELLQVESALNRM